jgi:hypothetical protein
MRLFARTTDHAAHPETLFRVPDYYQVI